MKNKTNYKKQNKPVKTLVVTIAAFTLFLAGCFDFENIYQPYHADPNSYFDVQISAWAYGGEYHAMPRFGTLLPVGWIPQDSIAYFDSTSTFVGTLIYSDSLSQMMSSIDPPPDNYYWWVAGDTVYIGGSTYNFDLRIYTDAQTGNFFIDYMLGDDSWHGLNAIRSNEHLIIVGDIQGCAPEGIVLSTQAEVDSFQLNYPGCSELAGDISISGNDITNLNGLLGISQIGGSLRMENNTTLISLIGLNDLTSIGGSFYFTNNGLLEGLSGLNSLTTIGQHFKVDTNQLLADFSGLESLVSVGRNFSITGNPSLESMSGLDNLVNIGESFIIGGYYDEVNNALGSLTGLENLNSIGKDFQIFGNTSLPSLAGLENLDSIGANLWIDHNDSLITLSGLENLTFIGGQLHVSHNDAIAGLSGLVNLSYIGNSIYFGYNGPQINKMGLENVVSMEDPLNIKDNTIRSFFTELDNPGSKSNSTDILHNFAMSAGITINHNSTLTNLAGLESVTSTGFITISNNDVLSSLTGLNNLTSIDDSLSIDNNAALTSLAGLENLTSTGDITISNNDVLLSMTGLNNLASVDGSLLINYNAAVTSIAGLENVTTIGGDISIKMNTALPSLQGLENLTTIGGSITITHNAALTTIAGLENVVSMDGFLSIFNNSALYSLTGIDNINPASISQLYVSYNASLSTCEVQSVCGYLAAPNGLVSIHDNAPGCNSPEEVIGLCFVSVDEINGKSDFNIYPSPVGDFATLSFDGEKPGIAKVSLYNSMGTMIKTWQFKITGNGQNDFVMDLSALPAGMYFIRLQTKNKLITKKIIKQ